MENPFDLLKYKSTLKGVDEKTIKQFQNIFPEFVMEEWKERGFANYLGGLLQTTNPNDYYHIIEGWVAEPQKCHVILRTAFGSFYYLKDGEYYNINVVDNLKSHLQNNFRIIIKFSLSKKDSQKDILHKDIYDKAVKRLGIPNYDEVYAFVPAISFGGDYNPDNIQKVNLKSHLAFLEQLK
jgi:hypothetical protein